MKRIVLAASCLLSFAFMALSSCGHESASPSVSYTSRSNHPAFSESNGTEEYSTTTECVIHSWEIVEKIDATCTSTGRKSYKCTRCGETKTAAVDKLGHSWQEADCENPKRCTRCGATEGSPKHKYNQTEATAATCTVDGVIKFKCSVCGDEYSETEPATGHTWKDATCTQPKFCTTCGASEGSALGHTDGTVCSRCGQTTTMTTGQYYAIQKAKSHLEYSAYSRKSLIDRLVREDFTRSDAEYAADHCGANYFEQALQEAKSHLKYSAYSRDGLIERLERDDYTHEEAVYGADKSGANWKEQAVQEARDTLKYGAYSRTGLIERLKHEDFTNEEAVYGADNCGANWKEQATQEAIDILKYASYSRTGMIQYLKQEDFTSEEAVYGADNCGANWNTQAAEEAKSYLKYMSASRKEVYEYLLGENFTDAEATYGADHCGADWKQEAADCAKEYLKWLSLSESDLKLYLYSDGFTYDQIEYALKSVGY